MTKQSFLPLNDRLLLQTYVTQSDKCGGFYEHWVDHNVYWGHVEPQKTSANAMQSSVDGALEDIDLPKGARFHVTIRDLTSGGMRFTKKSRFVWNGKRYRPLTQPIYRSMGRYSTFDIMEEVKSA